MHPSLHEHLANQRRDALLREADTTRLLNNVDRQLFITSIKPLILYLLVGSPLPSGKPTSRGIPYEQAHSNAALRVTGLIALALGVLVGSMLDGRFGLAPAVLLDSAILLVMIALVAARSIGLLKAHRL